MIVINGKIFSGNDIIVSNNQLLSDNSNSNIHNIDEYQKTFT